MFGRLFAILLMLVLVACGSSPASSPGGGTPAGPGSSTAATSGTQPTSPPPEGGDGEPGDLSAAVDALTAHDSWTFEVHYFVSALDTGIESSVIGTERRKPLVAVDASHSQPTGTAFHYTRIGNDIWSDVGTGEPFHYDAAESENLIEQYEPFHLNGLVEAAERSNVEYEPVGEDEANGIPAFHYRLSEADRENIVQLTDLEPDQWAGDFWVARDGGHLVRLAWGPQSVDTAQPTIGFIYDVTAVDCTCPIEPPG